jgi:hypothetical protein
MMAFVRNKVRAGTFSVTTSDLPGRFQRLRQLREPTMVDRASLEILGFIFGGVTAIVIAIAVIVVQSHVSAPLALDQRTPIVPASLSAQR